ncbi:MAG TPA: ATP-binding protein [Stellaceae bacterium]|jgi:two-component system nitrogen regulation sensor histidine kinase GlnL|nr:ATP-binding protein [Stellaceae bacterium]
MKTSVAARRGAWSPALDPAAVLAALPDPVLVIDERGALLFANAAAEQFFDASAATLLGAELRALLPPDSPIFALIDSVRASGHSVSEYGVAVETPRLGAHVMTVQAAPVAENRAEVVVTLQERSIAHKIDRQLTHRNAARSVTAMAAMLAHEVKNPLSGIRGAAQLLEENASAGDRELTRLICDESDRICALVDRMEVFSDRRPIERGPINIHEVLERVRLVAQTGFARHVRFIEEYDPSLPAVHGNRDLLIQVFLNLVKNAAEAVPAQGGEIQITTAYQHGVRLAVAGSESRVHLPLVISIVDNGEGIPEELGQHLFDPFVTTKHNGTGLGLALVAKVIGDHGGVIEFDSQPRRTVFRVFLPMAPRGAGGAP